MSDNYLKIIPEDPQHVPPAERHKTAVHYLENLFPKGGACVAKVYDAVQFIDQGGNMEAVICPACGRRSGHDHFSESDPMLQWWLELMDQTVRVPAEAIVSTSPCCRASVRLVDLEFDWPAGFARFEVSIRNPNVSRNKSTMVLADLEQILGCKLKLVWAHY